VPAFLLASLLASLLAFLLASLSCVVFFGLCCGSFLGGGLRRALLYSAAPPLERGQPMLKPWGLQHSAQVGSQALAVAATS
jgi:hypothetical protein